MQENSISKSLSDVLTKAYTRSNTKTWFSLLKNKPHKSEFSIFSSTFTTDELLKSLFIVLLALLVAKFLYLNVPWRLARKPSGNLKIAMYHISIFVWVSSVVYISSLAIRRGTSKFPLFNLTKSATLKQLKVFGALFLIINVLFCLFLVALNNGTAVIGFVACAFTIILTFIVYVADKRLLLKNMSLMTYIAIFAASLVIILGIFLIIQNQFEKNNKTLKHLIGSYFKISLIILSTSLAETFLFEVIKTLILSKSLQNTISENIKTHTSGLYGDIWKFFALAFIAAWSSAILKGINMTVISALLTNKIKRETDPKVRYWKDSLACSFDMIPKIAYYTIFPELFHILIFMAEFAASMVENLHLGPFFEVISLIIRCFKSFLSAISFLFNCNNQKNFAISAYRRCMHGQSNDPKEDLNLEKSKYAFFIANISTMISVFFKRSVHLILPLFFMGYDKYLPSVISKNIFILYLCFQIIRQLSYMISTAIIIEHYSTEDDLNRRESNQIFKVGISPVELRS